jgi:uncharacterized repeat protein (TIGR03803 family)
VSLANPNFPARKIMRSANIFRVLTTIALTAAFSMFAFIAHAAAQTESTLYQFDGSSGENPYGGLVFDAHGNLYGTTNIDGKFGYGTVYELSPAVGGGWTTTVLHNFAQKSSGGSYPAGALVFDAAGNLYGTTEVGGGHDSGVVYELVPQSNGTWTEKPLHQFSGADGVQAMSGVVFDSAGNLYGTTWSGGAYNYGVAFKLTPQTNGTWKETVLHSFGNGKDGQNPSGTLLVDSSGNVYGTTAGGGNYGVGIAFELSPKSGGGWTESAMHEFGNSKTDGQNPYGGFIFDAAGNLYGTTSGGGTGSLKRGTVFELSPKAGGGWTETLLYSFNGPDGSTPISNLTFDAAGNLYGTTQNGGVNQYGAVFELSPNGSGGWSESVLYSFYGENDGSFPRCAPIFDSAGNIYGTTSGQGRYSTAFEVTP